jgi:hypothetical protein
VTLKEKKNDRAKRKEVALQKRKEIAQKEVTLKKRRRAKEIASSALLRHPFVARFLLCSLRSHSFFFLDSVASTRIAPVFPTDRPSQLMSEDCRKLDPSNFQQLELQFLS